MDTKHLTEKYSNKNRLEHTDKNCKECDRIQEGAVEMANLIELEIFNGCSAEICALAICLLMDSCIQNDPMLMVQASQRLKKMQESGSISVTPLGDKENGH